MKNNLDLVETNYDFEAKYGLAKLYVVRGLFKTLFNVFEPDLNDTWHFTYADADRMLTRGSHGKHYEGDSTYSFRE